jgi:hypothetical protein
MNQALNRTTPQAAPTVFSRSTVARGWAGPADNNAAAARLLDDVLDRCGAGLHAMRAGSRVTLVRDERFDAAVELYRDGDWALAFERLTALADQDHAVAARLALLMLRYGLSLYGVRFAARPTQVARWAQRVLRATSRATASPSSITASA